VTAADSPRKREVRRAFERAAPAYDGAARVQREAAARLFDFARTCPRPAHVCRMLDAGCGTGQALSGLMAHFPRAHCIAVDFSAAMLARARASGTALLCADVERLPLADASVDLYWSSLALQWCAPATALAEAARVLAPGGAAWIATLGPRTLHELRAAFAAVDDAAHVIDFASAGHWRDAARAAGLSILSSAQEPLRDLAADLRTLLGNIKAIGARTVGEKRRKTPLGRRGWQTLQSAYETFRRPDGTLPATYDLILLALRKPP
jgi:malonyl-CoA O-methyltransferase